MKDKEYFLHLYEIARLLNNEFSLRSASSKVLEKTVEIFDLETGWIWLTEPNNKSVYLAASHNLPPALSNSPERLSGWCYCIDQYLSDDMDHAMNISEIACSRLKDIPSGTNKLKFHATIPITIGNQKAGIINLLSKETRQFSQKELAVLNTISELVGAAIQRTRIPYNPDIKKRPKHKLKSAIEHLFIPRIDEMLSALKSAESDHLKLEVVLSKILILKKDVEILLNETKVIEGKDSPMNEFSYPDLPITNRELEVLTLIKEGLTNEQIGARLYISERTVKFHVTSILSKLNANNRTEAVNIGQKRGFFNI